MIASLGESIHNPDDLSLRSRGYRLGREVVHLDHTYVQREKTRLLEQMNCARCERFSRQIHDIEGSTQNTTVLLDTLTTRVGDLFDRERSVQSALLILIFKGR